MPGRDNQGGGGGQGQGGRRRQGGNQGQQNQQGGGGQGGGGGGQGQGGNFIQTGPMDEQGQIIEEERGQGVAAEPSQDQRKFTLKEAVRVRTSEGVANFWFVEQGEGGQGRAISLENELSGRVMTLPADTEIYLCAAYGKTDTFMVGIKFPNEDKIQGAVMRRMSIEHITGPDVLPGRREADRRSERNQGAGQSAALGGDGRNQQSPGGNQGSGQSQGSGQRGGQQISGGGQGGGSGQGQRSGGQGSSNQQNQQGGNQQDSSSQELDQLIEQKLEEKLSAMGLAPSPDVDEGGQENEIKINTFEDEPSVGA